MLKPFHLGRKVRNVLCAIALFGFAAPEAANAAEAYIRVVDVGTGLCVVARTPAGRNMVYDAGGQGRWCVEAVDDIIGDGEIDLLVLSHSDADHISNAVEILHAHTVRTILHPGDDRPLTNAQGGRNALGQLRDAIATSGAQVIGLEEYDVDFGYEFDIGAATAVFVAGWNDGHATEHAGESRLRDGPLNNALSIVIRYEYGGHSVLLTGDTVGRRTSDRSGTACRYAERFMANNTEAVPIASDVLIGQHHGADNSSSLCFLQAVRPRYVIFSAGHHDTYRHPRANAARRILQAHEGLEGEGMEPIPAEHIFRTDWRDHQGGAEWIYGALAGCNDQPGDDDVEVWLPDQPSEPVRVNYRYQNTNTCRSRD